MVDIVSVERHLRFQAQRVAGAEAARLDVTTRDQLPKNGWAVLRRDVNLEAVFTGVAGARNDGRRAVNDPPVEVVVLHRGEIQVGVRLQNPFGVGTLQRELRVVVTDIAYFNVHSLRALEQPLVVLIRVRSVDDDKEIVRCDLVDEDVIDESCGGVKQAVVLCAPGLELRNIIACRALQQRQCLRTFDRDLAHVRDVE